MAYRFSNRFRSLFLLAAAATLAACSSTPGTTPFLASQSQHFASAQSVQFAVPPSCKGQVTTGTHASDAEKLLATGGHLCIPAFGGFGGTVAYPSANPPVGIKLTSSTSNYNGKLPSLHSGSPIFYLQIATSGATTFGTNVPAGGGLTSQKIVPGDTYTIYGQAVVLGFTVNFTPCYAVATSGKFGGVIRGVATPLKGLAVPAAAKGVLEVYAGQSATGAC